MLSALGDFQIFEKYGKSLMIHRWPLWASGISSPRSKSTSSSPWRTLYSPYRWRPCVSNSRERSAVASPYCVSYFPCSMFPSLRYIRKIHYLGTKMEDAKGAVITGGNVLKHTGIEVFRTAGGKLVQVRGAVLSSKQARELGMEYILTECQKN